MEAIISVIAILVMISVTMVLLYQNAVLKDKVNANLRSLVDQVNDSTMYAYKFDTNQDVNIKNLDNNVKIIAESLQNVTHNVKAMQMQVQDSAQNATMLRTQNVRTGVLNLGNKFSLSGVGDAVGNDEWLRLMDPAGKEYFGGAAMGKLYVDNGSTLKGVTDAGILNVKESLSAKGGKLNGQNMTWNSYFPYTDGINYIRGDTILNGAFCIGNTCITEAQLANIKKVTAS